MLRNLARLLGFASLFAMPIVGSFAETKLQDGTILSDKPTFIVTYIEAAVGTEDEVAESDQGSYRSQQK